MTASGERIAHYRLVRKLGEGGMGEVHRAVDERLGRDVAIKLLPSHITQSESQTRLVREAQAAGQLNHPGIVTVHDVGIWRQRVYVVMELVDGKPLSRVLKDGMSARQAVVVCAEAASALAAAHRRGILHRDIKPDNIMLTGDGRVKVLDFGLAKLRAQVPAVDAEALVTEVDAGAPTEVDGNPGPTNAATVATEVGFGPAVSAMNTPGFDRTLLSPSSPTPISGESPWASLTFAGSLLGTPAYMSPEQAASQPLDARSEVYSLGLVLYELVSGKRPLVRESVNQTLDAARAADVPPLPAGAAPRPVVKLLARALAADPADRFADMDEMAAELRATAEALAPRWRKRALLIGGATLLAGGAAAIGLAAAGGDHESAAPAPPAPAAADFAVSATRAITTDPGCEEYPSFTPDGREILFDGRIGRDTEIQAIAVEGGVRRRLTRSPGWDMAAAPSPDGKRVAYVHFTDTGRELRVMDIAGDQAATPLTVGACRGFPSWAPDGSLLYGDDSGRLFRVEVDRTPLRPEPIAELPPDLVAAFVEQFPDGQIIASLRSDAETSSLIRIASGRPGGKLETLQPRVIVSDCCNLRADRDGRGFYHVGLTPSNYSIVHWRPRAGGDPIALESVVTTLRGFDVAPAGDHMVVSSCNLRSLAGTIEDGEFHPMPRVDPAWEPAGFDMVDPDWIVIASARAGPAQIWRLYVNGEAELLIDTPSKSPALSPDGTRLAWANQVTESPGLRVRAIAGGAVITLSNDPSDDTPVFSPDGRRLFFASTTAEGTRVFAVAADGSGKPQPVSPPGVVAFAVASGRERLAVILDHGTRRELLVGPPGGPFQTVPVAGGDTLDLVAFGAGDAELLVSPRRNVLLAVTPGRSSEPRVVWTASDDTLFRVRVGPDGVLRAVVSADEGELFLVDGRFR